MSPSVGSHKLNSLQRMKLSKDKSIGRLAANDH